MGRDNHPRVRQAAKLARKQGRRKSADRVLIVTEGTKTEPNYFEEIRTSLRLPTADIHVTPCEYGTCPHQIVTFARNLFNQGDIHRRIPPKAFERVYAVFDRDDHAKYHEALSFAEEINNKGLRNDQGKKIEFKAIASVPCFELWLLLHFQECNHPMHRDEVYASLKAHMPDYEKGAEGYYALTSNQIGLAKERAEHLQTQTNKWNGYESFTEIHELVGVLRTLKK